MIYLYVIMYVVCMYTAFLLNMHKSRQIVFGMTLCIKVFHDFNRFFHGDFCYFSYDKAFLIENLKEYNLNIKAHADYRKH